MQEQLIREIADCQRVIGELQSRKVESQRKRKQDITHLTRQIDELQNAISTKSLELARWTQEVARDRRSWKPGDPPTPDPRPVGQPHRGPGQYPWYRNVYDRHHYPQDEYREERAQAVTGAPGGAPWGGGHYIPGAEIKIIHPAHSVTPLRVHDPPFVQHGHPAHVSETKVVIHQGRPVRVWADGVIPHS